LVFEFLKGLDKDIQGTLLSQLRDLWTHTSTAIEGNTLSLGDTKFILEEGLTVSGKPIKDHQEVIGHAKAIELIYSMLGRKITENDFFELHRAVQTEKVTDIYKPYGAWKVEPNGTYAVNDEGQQVFVEYAHPGEVPALMKSLVNFINESSELTMSFELAADIYAKIHMGIAHTHPFWDGNGRIARLVANIPLLNAGLPPIVITSEDRREYIETLARYQRVVGEIEVKTGVWPQPSMLSEFTIFCGKSYKATILLIDLARKQQALRNKPR
jgi:Fic family protein